MTKKSGYNIDNPPDSPNDPLHKKPSFIKHWLLAHKGTLLATALGAPVVLTGVARCSVESPYPTEPFKEESVKAFRMGAGDMLGKYHDFLIWAGTGLGKGLYKVTGMGPADAPVGTPKYILVCEPREKSRIPATDVPNMDPKTRTYAIRARDYFNKMDDKVEDQIMRQSSDTWSVLKKGWHPVITYSGLNSNGELRLTPAASMAEQKCDMDHTPNRIKVPEGP